MRVSIDTAELRTPAPWEWVLRFVFGGTVTVATGLITRHWGSIAGGMLLAFPAILPATLTLIRRHDGRKQATADARGARCGTVGMAAFALVVAFTATELPAVLVLVLATAAWITAAGGCWLAFEARSELPDR